MTHFGSLLPPEFFHTSALELAPKLLGTCLVKTLTHGNFVAGEIVEVEAYLGELDAASHAYRGKTQRNGAVFLSGGHSYLHRIHQSWCLDIVADQVEIAGSVLIRALKPLSGIEFMKQQRRASLLTQLCSGPGKLCQALALDGEDNKKALFDTQSDLRLFSGDKTDSVLFSSSRRIGISQNPEPHWRFFVTNSPFLSRKTEEKGVYSPGHGANSQLGP